MGLAVTGFMKEIEFQIGALCLIKKKKSFLVRIIFLKKNKFTSKNNIISENK